MILEVCTGGILDGLVASKAGAQRIELNSALALGGLTPYVEDLVYLKAHTSLEIVAMVRCRGDGFCYREEELTLMYQQAENLLKQGADGIAFGFLNKDRTIDKEHTLKMVELIHSYHKTAVFHRAIDVCENMDEGISVLIDCGVDRLLSSGQQETAEKGYRCLQHIQEKYGHRIEILMGSGISLDNIHFLLEKTHINQVHASCKSYLVDPTGHGQKVSFSYHPLGYEVVDEEKVKRLLEVVR